MNRNQPRRPRKPRTRRLPNELSQCGGPMTLLRERHAMKIVLLFATMLCVLVAPAIAADTAAKKPNVLFCIADDASPHFGVYGYDWVKTPNIDRVAKAGLVFENVYT